MRKPSEPRLTASRGISAARNGTGGREQRAIAAEDEDELRLVLGDILAVNAQTGGWCSSAVCSSM